MRIDFSKYSSVRIGPVCEVEVLNSYEANPPFIIGGANNLLLSPTPPPLCILGENFSYIKKLDESLEFTFLEVGGGTNNKALFKYCKENNLKGLEFLAKIPGKLGGSLKMNAGVKDWCIGSCVFSVNDKKDFSFSYRASNLKEVVYKAVLRLKKGFDTELASKLDLLRNTQPKGPSFGSIFKNPEKDYAARLVEKVGLKGFCKGGAMISSKHANFLINKQNASFDDAYYLIKLAQKLVFEEFGIGLKTEVVIVRE